jgi:hypothetical protein
VDQFRKSSREESVTDAWTTVEELEIDGQLLLRRCGCTVLSGLLLDWRNSMATLSAVLGLLAGWATGILLAPYEAEEKRFQKFSKVVYGFVTGFFVSKIDRVFELIVDKQGGSFILDPTFARNLSIAVCCFLLAAITVFVSRSYWQATGDNP